MEFERAVFRVYERAVEGLAFDDNPNAPNSSSTNKICRLFEVFLLMLGIGMVACVVSFHRAFVWNPGCIPASLAALNSSQPIVLQDDDILGIYVYNDHMKSMLASSRGRSGDDDLYRAPESAELLKNSFHNFVSGAASFIASLPIMPTYAATSTHSQSVISKLLYHKMQPDSSSSNSSSSLNTPTWDFDFVATFSDGVTFMSEEMLLNHNFRLVNMSLVGADCFGGQTLESLLLATSSLDLALVNNVMATSKLPGYLHSAYGSYYHWSEQDLIRHRSFSDWLSWKITMLLNSAFSFFLLSTSSALLVRVLLTSGVILIIPLCWLLRLCGVGRLNMRIVSLSYPWIGHPLQALERQSIQASYAFIFAHITRLFIFYTLYIAAQAVFASWFYNDVTLAADMVWLFGAMVLWEYYSLIFLRAAHAIYLFPRVSLALFLIFHFYCYSYPTGFHSLAFGAVCCFILFLMIYCVRVYEVKAFRQGLVSFEQPRMLYSSLPWPSWAMDIAPDYTLFMPVTHRSGSLYAGAVPNRPGDQAATPAPDQGTRPVGALRTYLDRDNVLRQRPAPDAAPRPPVVTSPTERTDAGEATATQTQTDAQSVFTWLFSSLSGRPGSNYQSIASSSQHTPDSTVSALHQHQQWISPEAADVEMQQREHS